MDDPSRWASPGSYGAGVFSCRVVRRWPGARVVGGGFRVSGLESAAALAPPQALNAKPESQRRRPERALEEGLGAHQPLVGESRRLIL